ITLLQSIYLRTRTCIPLISKSYATGPYPKHEFQAMLEREVLRNDGSLLPVRLDQTDLPALSSGIAFVNYDREEPERLADLVKDRLQHANRRPALATTVPTPLQHERQKVSLKSHVRQPATESFVISAPRILDLVLDAQQYASPELRARL